MKSTIIRIAVLGLLAGAMAGVPTRALAQATTNKPAAAKKESVKGAKKQSTLPFHGVAASVDKNGKVVTVGTLKIEITSETKLSKEGKPAILDDVEAGDQVTGSYRKTEDGKLVGVTINVGPKAPASQGKKKETPKQ